MLNVYTMPEELSTDQDEQWIAYLDVTEEKIVLLQTEVDFKRAELEAAAKENERVALRVSAIRSTISLLRQNMSPSSANRYARG
jgi:hypothetical protein